MGFRNRSFPLATGLKRSLQDLFNLFCLQFSVDLLEVIYAKQEYIADRVIKGTGMQIWKSTVLRFENKQNHLTINRPLNSVQYLYWAATKREIIFRHSQFNKMADYTANDAMDSQGTSTITTSATGRNETR